MGKEAPLAACETRQSGFPDPVCTTKRFRQERIQGLSITVQPAQRVFRGIGYRTVWRWHFYAGLFCIPFVLWLSLTGTIYLFKPQVEKFLDRNYD